MQRTRAELGPVDILICNAASNPHYGSLDTIDDAMFRKTLDNNILSNHWLIQLALPDMRAKGDGAIVVISSIGGLRGSSVLGAYTITKAADIQLVRNYAVENGKHGIRVNGIAPGLVKTDFAKALYENPAAEKAATERTRWAGSACRTTSPAPRYSSPPPPQAGSPGRRWSSMGARQSDQRPVGSASAPRTTTAPPTLLSPRA